MSKFKSLEEQTNTLHSPELRELNLNFVNQQNLQDLLILNVALNPLTREIVYSSKPNNASLLMLGELQDDSALIRSQWENKDEHDDLGAFNWSDES